MRRELERRRAADRGGLEDTTVLKRNVKHQNVMLKRKKEAYINVSSD